MNNYLYIIFFCFIVLSVSACSSKTNTEEKEDTTRVITGDIKDSSGVHKFPESKSSLDISYRNENYNLLVTRMPNDSLPRVENSTGDIFLDNTITLRITRGSKKIIDRKFTKQNFASIVPANFLKNSILEGMVYDKTSPDGIVFAVSVCYPQTDLYFPISMTVGVDGKISMVKEESMEEYWEDADQE